MLKGGQVLEIHELFAQGLSIREIARRSGLSRNTVSKALQHRGVWKYKPRPRVGSKLDPFKPYLRDRVAIGVTNCIRLFGELQAQGYTGSYTLIREFVRSHRPPKRPTATVRFETSPGEQAQVDFGVFPYQGEGKRKRYYAFVMVLSYSRMTYVEFVEHQDLSTLIRCHIHAFAALGIPRTLLYDNLKPVVQGRDEYGKPLLNSRFADFALTMDFRPRICQPYRAQTKGRVERTIGYIRNHFWPGRTFSNLADLNQQVQTWCTEVANRRVHATTGQRPCDLWEQEPLQSLPAASVYASFLTEERTVSRDGYIHFAGSRYGVPWQHAGQRVEVRETSACIEILANGRMVAIHPRALYPRTTLTLPGQWDGLQAHSSRPEPDRLGIQIASPEVQVRPLAVYAALVGGESE